MAAKNESVDLSEIGFLLGRAYYSYIGLLQRWLDQEGLSEHLKPGMGSLLFALFRKDNRSFSEIADELQLAKSTMTGMVSRMRKAGLVTVTADATDSRVLRLRLTPLAISLKPQSRNLARKVERLLSRKLSQTAQQSLRNSLFKITQTIADELRTTGKKQKSTP